jgi:hypothetical protein
MKYCRRYYQDWALVAGLILACGFPGISSAQGAVIATSDFENGADGWTFDPPEGGTRPSSGGNPGGHLQFVDPGSPGTFVVAPAKYLGDLSSLDGLGLLEYDHRILSHSTPGCVVDNYFVDLSGPGGTARWIGPQAPDGPWNTVSVSFDSSDWSVSSGTWSALLSDVQLLRMNIEIVDNSGPCPNEETSLIDNVSLIAPTSVPALSVYSTWILVTTLMSCALILRWRYRRA